MNALAKATTVRCASISSASHLSLFLLLVSLALFPEPWPALADEQPPQTLPAERTNPDTDIRAVATEITTAATKDTSSPAPGLALGYALLVAILGGLIVWCRVLARFQPFWGLGVSRNVYTISLIIAVGSLSGVCYLILAGRTMTGTGLLPDSWSWLPGFESQAAAQTMTIVGGSVLGQAATIVFRFLRGRPVKTLSSAQVEELRKITTSNLVYVLIRERIAAKMSQELIKLARRIDQETIRITAIRLITDQVTIGSLPPQEGDELVRKISDMKPTGDARNVEQVNYEMLHAALRAGGFRQLQSRFAEAMR